MSWSLFGVKPEPMLTYGQLDPREQMVMNINRNSNIFFDENAFENVICKMPEILSPPQNVNS